MVTRLLSGHYKLIETNHHIKVIYLDRDAYAWIEPKGIGEMLVRSRNPHKTDCILSIGQYRLYDVHDEAKLSDQIHLELETGQGHWQGYLLLSGLPNESKKRARIIPTPETITGHRHAKRRIRKRFGGNLIGLTGLGSHT